MYSIAAPIRYLYSAMWWTYTKFVIRKRSSVKGILSLANEFKCVTATTSKITCWSPFFYWILHWITGLYGLSNWLKSAYGVRVAQSWFNMSILECCLMKHVTQSSKRLSIPWWMTWSVSSRINVIQNTYFIFLKPHSNVRTTSSPRYSLAFCLSLKSHWVGSIIRRRNSSYSLNHRDN
jgi:hypothetical protein